MQNVIVKVCLVLIKTLPFPSVRSAVSTFYCIYADFTKNVTSKPMLWPIVSHIIIKQPMLFSGKGLYSDEFSFLYNNVV